jgi:hypothetical protein
MSPWVCRQSHRCETLARSPRQQAFAALRALPDLGSVRPMNAPGMLAEKAAFESPSAPPRLANDVRGAVMVEYVVVLLLVSTVACAAIVVLGMAMARFYMAQEAWLGIPFP